MSHKLTIPNIDIELAEVTKLRQYAAFLRFKLEEILPKDADIRKLQSQYNLTRHEAIVLSALANGRLWSGDQLLTSSLSWNRDGGRTPNLIKVYISKLRKKLPNSITITNVFAVGYRITRGLEELQKTINETEALNHE